jgi:hypothetical protein
MVLDVTGKGEYYIDSLIMLSICGGIYEPSLVGLAFQRTSYRYKMYQGYLLQICGEPPL